MKKLYHLKEVTKKVRVNYTLEQIKEALLKINPKEIYSKSYYIKNKPVIYIETITEDLITYYYSFETVRESRTVDWNNFYDLLTELNIDKIRF